MQRVHLWGPVSLQRDIASVPNVNAAEWRSGTMSRYSLQLALPAQVNCPLSTIIKALPSPSLSPLHLSLFHSQFQPSSPAPLPQYAPATYIETSQPGLAHWFQIPIWTFLCSCCPLTLFLNHVFDFSSCRLMRWWICQGILRNFTWWHCFPFCWDEATGHVLCMLGTLAVAQMRVPFLLFLSLGTGKQTETAIK